MTETCPTCNGIGQVPESFCKVGDPDATPYGAYGSGEKPQGCWVADPDSWVCTRNRGHTGYHVAGDGDEVCAVWL